MMSVMGVMSVMSGDEHDELDECDVKSRRDVMGITSWDSGGVMMACAVWRRRHVMA
jgi:hypothetical protein